ncbi:MAG: arsenate reductase ArsC [Desulfobulbaceae bacterium]|nr:MAG: arsenate reductase ArsC [Desulfobulbaceae bacterium]
MKSVLFICVENSCRSQIAEAFGKMLGQDVIACHSSGSRPSGMINQKAIASMRKVGYDLATHISKSLNEIPDIEYDLAITMGCEDKCPWVRAKERQDWKIPDPKHMDAGQLDQMRDLIRGKVTNLISKYKGT